ncbi:hypothetical protein B4168_2304 [Anoxybacillus flavithermus]|nr:hypothetical protein B4168_2304 [Anoxybacillus flavithermus]OAO85957.1 hypothetical protein GT23_2860 [Parageobacillus thermoglucosidasius]
MECTVLPKGMTSAFMDDHREHPVYFGASLFQTVGKRLYSPA